MSLRRLPARRYVAEPVCGAVQNKKLRNEVPVLRMKTRNCETSPRPAFENKKPARRTPPYDPAGGASTISPWTTPGATFFLSPVVALIRHRPVPPIE